MKEQLRDDVYLALRTEVSTKIGEEIASIGCVIVQIATLGANEYCAWKHKHVAAFDRKIDLFVRVRIVSRCDRFAESCSATEPYRLVHMCRMSPEFDKFSTPHTFKTFQPAVNRARSQQFPSDRAQKFISEPCITEINRINGASDRIGNMHQVSCIGMRYMHHYAVTRF